MPKVGGKHFPYTESGYAAARKAAKKTGKGVTYGKRGKPGAKPRPGGMRRGY